MHIHKINPNSQEHQNFLAQNRKDPITGDSILEGDEVVFCAGCKSVFLKDTWEYLGNRHCEQSETLIDFPVQELMQLKAKERILFYQTLDTYSTQISIPARVKKAPWITKKRHISPYYNLFYSIIKPVTITAFWLLTWLIFFIVYLNGFLSFFISILLTFLFNLIHIVVRKIHDKYYGKKQKTLYKYFNHNTFFLTKHSLIFSHPYGVKEYILSLKYITTFVFHETKSTFDDSFCTIFYKKEDFNRSKMSLKFVLPDNTFYKDSFFDSLSLLSSFYSIPIIIDAHKENTILKVQEIINGGNTNVSFLN
ncbi:hypothetical protein V9L05_00815 [Bernardetia sp. Wsw4-3y2]|uniref:hypothetical protein n=1 Tax=Bernardetia sp. Wsw4-3y2 TaxID=3127471 RepID=UPI0030CF89FB